MNLSVVVPLLNEEESLHELYARIDKVCKENQLSYEIWFIDDGVQILLGKLLKVYPKKISTFTG